MGLGEELQSIDTEKLLAEHQAWSSLGLEDQQTMLDVDGLREKYPALTKLAEVITFRGRKPEEASDLSVIHVNARNRAVSAFIFSLVRYAESSDLPS